jgi:hypothetical protein
LNSNAEFSSAVDCKIALENCITETPSNTAAGIDGAGDNYVVSDMQAVTNDDDNDGLVYTLETMESYLSQQSLLLPVK